MWYNKSRPHEVKAPTSGQLITLRLMILMGLAGMIAFFFGILREDHIGYPPLYYLLIFSLFFFALKTSYEWYHYFSISIPKQPPLNQKYTVDIFTTFCPGEPYDMVVETLEAIQQISYPHTAYLCDEANDPYLVEVCERLGVRHVTRNNRVDAKAGNINNALKQATGDICVILDPDHVPAPDFLDHVLPHFEDPNIGFVQVVQAYKNSYENTIAKGAAQQTFQFYGPMMMTMNSYGTAQAIGANCTFRRAALDSIGGHAPGLAEDMHTSMKLHAKGWKSVYVPKVLTRGLVPSSLSAYYKQQLKWSRGVFELLLTTYAKNFLNFTWRQKIHYGLLPWHYFSGAIYLINFLIPIISLLTGKMPMQMNLIQFLLWGSLFFGSTYLIRHYVQRWVMEEDERGFHLVGGLLLIGTWWIHLLGFIFTLLRRKVPYNPTPKDGKDENTFELNLPNLGIGALSIFAIVYGLHRDLNPYTLIMSGFAALNILFITFMIWISYENRYRKLLHTNILAKRISLGVHFIKEPLWIFRHKIYGLFRIFALPMLLFLIGGLYYYAYNKDITQVEPMTPRAISSSRYLGIFAPDGPNGVTNLQTAKRISSEYQLNPSIISIYLAWEPNGSKNFPDSLFEEIFQQKAYPMLTWEPWLAHGKNDTISVMNLISSGAYDDYLEKMAEKFKALQKPFFLRFAHEPDNPAYPWYSSNPSAAKDYKKAWKYVHRYMTDHQVDNLIWVYNPWKASAATSYFPGGHYVDWLGVTALNYASAVKDQNWNTFDDIYAPFHRTLAFQQGLPVMLAEFGTLHGNGDPVRWFQNAYARMEEKYPEVQACVLFASNYDTNLPDSSDIDTLRWRDFAQGFSAFKDFPQNIYRPKEVFLSTPIAHNDSTPGVTEDLFEKIKGVNYVKSQDWKASMHPLFKDVIEEDFDAIKALQLNTIKRYGPGVYDKTILKIAQEKELNVIYGIWIERNIDFLQDEELLESTKDRILKTIDQRKDEVTIKAWHLGNPVWHQLGENFNKPQLLYQRQAYLDWLADLIADIKNTDPTRPVSIELDFDPYLLQIATHLHAKIRGLDALGINMPEDTSNIVKSTELLKQLPLSAFINRLSGQSSEIYDQLATGWLIRSWQDEVFENYVSFDGLLNHNGRKKMNYLYLQQRIEENLTISLPEVQILRPAQPTRTGLKLRYHALLKKNGKWTLASFTKDNLDYNWQLVKVDAYDNSLAMREEGKGVAVEVSIPPNPHLYKLRLIISNGNYSTSTETPLNTPMYTGPDLQELSRYELEYLFQESKKGK